MKSGPQSYPKWFQVLPLGGLPLSVTLLSMLYPLSPGVAVLCCDSYFKEYSSTCFGLFLQKHIVSYYTPIPQCGCAWGEVRSAARCEAVGSEVLPRSLIERCGSVELVGDPSLSWKGSWGQRCVVMGCGRDHEINAA